MLFRSGIINGTEGQTIAYKDSEGQIFSVKPNVSEDGTTLESIDVTSNKETANFLTQQGAFSQGFTINDLRNVNALQKYLEVNQRKGYRYKDLIEGHFDVNIKYDELNYPEFLGGVSKELYVNPVIATAQSPGNETQAPVSIGDYAGNAGVLGQTDSITKYCDEHGFIIAILSIVPVPVYSQTLPSFFVKNKNLDYYSPEFANIGLQPLSKNLLCPLQFHLTAEDETSDTFGYQRPHADYIRSLDESHGLFRTQLRNFILNREFKTTPELGREFIQCRPDQLNDIFASTLDSEDKLIGDLFFQVEKQSSVPFISLPQLD